MDLLPLDASILREPRFWLAHHLWRTGPRVLDACFPGAGPAKAFNRTPFYARLLGFERGEAERRLRQLADAGGDADAAARRALGELVDFPGLLDLTRAGYATAAESAALPDFSVRLGFADGWAIVVAYGIRGPDIRFTLGHSSRPEPLFLGSFGPDGMMPALRWPEVADLAARVVSIEPAAGLEPRILALRLLAPSASTTGADDPAAVRRLVAEAWAEEPAVGERLGRALARRAAGVAWRHDADRGWVCTDEHSMRHPRPEDRYGFFWKAADFAFARRFLEAR